MMNDYKEMIEYLRATANEMTAADVHAFGVDDDVVVESEDAGMLRNAADVIEQLVKERDAYAKAFRITSSDDPLINHAVVKIDYEDIIAHSTDELVCAIAYRLSRVIEDARSTGGL